jgi:hypothetical protein
MSDGRTVVLGDLHGCSKELRQLLTEHLRPKDQLFAVGDLINRGPDPRGVLDLVREHEIRCVMGNHEDGLLRWRRGERRQIKAYENRTVALLRPEDWEFIETLPLYRRLPSGGLVVHAGVDPRLPVEKNSRGVLLNLRCLDRWGRMNYRTERGWDPWPVHYPVEAGPFVIFGHNARRDVRRWANAICIDTGCVYGGRLTAYILEEDRCVQVQAHRVYYDPIVGHSGRKTIHSR